MALYDLNRAGDTAVPTLKLNEVAAVNWRRYPTKVLTVAMLTPANVAAVSYSGGIANVGAAAGNGGETGTANSTSPTSGQGWTTQTEKAAALGVNMATDVTKSYQGTRGAIEAHEPYPSTDTTEVLPAFRRSDYISPGGP